VAKAHLVKSYALDVRSASNGPEVDQRQSIRIKLESIGYRTAFGWIWMGWIAL